MGGIRKLVLSTFILQKSNFCVFAKIPSTACAAGTFVLKVFVLMEKSPTKKVAVTKCGDLD